MAFTQLAVSIRDVQFGSNVTVVQPCNLYECSIGDNCFIGPFVEIQKGVVIGNVAVPTYKTKVLFLLPFGKGLGNNNIHCIDYNHLSILNKWGVKIRWYEKLLYNIRPKLQGNNGRGVL